MGLASSSAAPMPSYGSEGGFFTSIKRAVGMEPPAPPPEPTFLDSFRETVGLEPRPRSRMNTIRNALGMEQRQPTMWDEINDTFTMSLQNRVYGFGICLGLAVLLFLLSVVCIYLLLFVPFGVCYTLGNIFLLSSTFFLVGPMRQLKYMFSPVRIIASLIYLAALGLTIFVAFTSHSFILVLVCVIIQIGALVWYVASYIPYCRACLQGTCKSCFKGVTGAV